MLKKLPKILIFLILAVFLVASNVMALPLTDRLEGVFNDIAEDKHNDVNVYNDMLSDAFDSTWMMTASNGMVATFIIELAGFASDNTFGVYDTGSSGDINFVELFAGHDGPGDHAFLFINADGSVVANGTPYDPGTFSGNSFGFYITTPQVLGYTYYSDTDLNPDDYDHMFAYQGTGESVKLHSNAMIGPWTDNEYILAWEDLYGGGDQDFEDLVVMVASVQPVPEPATMLLLGSGLIGLATFGRKKFFKKS